MSLKNDLVALVAGEIRMSGRTQASICEAIGISQKHLSTFLAGSAGMSLGLIDMIFAELGRKCIISSLPIDEPKANNNDD